VPLEVAAYDEGAHVTFLTQSQMGKNRVYRGYGKSLGGDFMMELNLGVLSKKP